MIPDGYNKTCVTQEKYFHIMQKNTFDLIVIGSGPGGYVAAIRASQLGMNVAIVEKESLGGICLNWGCIPTKALLRSANIWEQIQKSEDYGFKISKASIDFKKVIERSRQVAKDMNRGVDFLLKKNKITVIKGYGKILAKGIVGVEENVLYVNNSDETVVSKDIKSKILKSGDIHKSKVIQYRAENIIIATGARGRELPTLLIDNINVVGYRKVMFLDKIPKKMVIVGAGAIGCEFAYFYNTMGSKVTLIDFADNIVPLEDEEISGNLKKVFLKAGIEVLPSTEVLSNDNKAKTLDIRNVKTKEQSKIKYDIVLSSVGIVPNTENLGLEEVGIKTEHGRIQVDKSNYQTNVEGIYAIGDVLSTTALAHVASAEAVLCVEALSGLKTEPIDYNNIPSCTYCMPEIASVGYTEEQAKKIGYDIKVGKFPFIASGKASAYGYKEGFVKVIFDAKYGEWLGAHMIGANVTDLIAEVVVARKLETTSHEILKSIHPHPTLSEAVLEAVADAYSECVHI